MRKPLLVLSLVHVTLIGLAEERQAAIPAVTAMVEDSFTRTLPDGNVLTKKVTGLYFRDANGRTRIERGTLVTIHDPITRSNTVIDLTTKVARRMTGATQGSAPSPPLEKKSDAQTHRELGTRMINGVMAVGTEFSVAVPPGAVGNLQPLVRTSEVWRSLELALPIRIKSSDPLTGEHVQNYLDIKIVPMVEASLFVVPPDIQVIDVTLAPHRGTQNLR